LKRDPLLQALAADGYPAYL